MYVFGNKFLIDKAKYIFKIALYPATLSHQINETPSYFTNSGNPVEKQVFNLVNKAQFYIPLSYCRGQFDKENAAVREWTDATEERCVELEAMAQVPKANSEEAKEEMATITVRSFKVLFKDKLQNLLYLVYNIYL